MLEVLIGAGIMFVGMMTGWAANNVAHKQAKGHDYDAVSKKDDTYIPR